MSHPEFENPELLPEYLQALQDELDVLRARNDSMTRRIDRLEKERETLRQRLPRRKRPPTPNPKASTRRELSVEVPGVGKIPDLTLPVGPIARPNLRVAAVLDEFSRTAFQYEFAITDLSSIGWREVLEESQPHLLLVESAYRGHDGSWAGRVARFGDPSEELTGVVEWCRSNRVPTVFWNKEDPINHDWFLASANLFDWVLTVDSNMVDVYRRNLIRPKVDVMQFAAQPVIHHPGDQKRANRVAFAGSYYAAKHPDRREQMEMLLTAATSFGLDIFDRMDRPLDPRFQWPERFRKQIGGSLTYPQTLEAYRRYGAFINVNTVTNSPTMCARRIYELLACGAQVVSGPSAALDGVPVLLARHMDEARSQVELALSRGENTEGMAWVANGNTVGHRVERLIELVL